MSFWSEQWNQSSSRAAVTPPQCYESVRGSCLRLSRPAGVLVLMYAAVAVSILVTVLGNLLVILSISYFRQLRSPTNKLLRSLAVCDLLLGLLVMPYSGVRSIQGCLSLGSLVCKLHTSIDIMLCTTSIFHLCSIGIDRYLAVCQPLLYPSLITPTALGALVATSWLVPALFAFGMTFSGFNLKGIGQFFYDHFSCDGGCPLFLSPVASVVAACFAFFLPALVMVCVYAKIYYVARRQAKAIKHQVFVRGPVRSIKEQVLARGQARSVKNKVFVRGQGQPTKGQELATGQARSTKDLVSAGGPSGSIQTQQTGQLRETENRRKESRESRRAGILAVVLGVFLLCWCPFFFCLILDPFLSYSVPPVLMDVLTWLGYLNSTLNPIVYAFLYTWFRRALRVIVSGDMVHGGSQRLQFSDYQM